MVLRMGPQEHPWGRFIGKADCEFTLQRRVRIQAVGSTQGRLYSRVLREGLSPSLR